MTSNPYHTDMLGMVSMSSLTSMSIYRWILIRHQVGRMDIGKIIIYSLCREQYPENRPLSS